MTILAEDDVMRLAGALSPLQAQALERMTRRRPCPVETYLRLVGDARRFDLTGEVAQDFRRTFNGYYGVRRNAVWRSHFYRLFEKAKTVPAEFETILGELHSKTDRIEASFVSKLLATLDPELPVLDSVVRAFLARHVPVPRFGGADQAVIFHRYLTDTMARLATTSQALEWSGKFAQCFESVEGANKITTIKRLDFLIWAGSR